MRVVALVGPPGAGKTSCIARLAARYGIARRKAAHIIALDDYRIGGGEQLRAYAAVLGVGFETRESRSAADEGVRRAPLEGSRPDRCSGLQRCGDRSGGRRGGTAAGGAGWRRTWWFPHPCAPADLRRIVDGYGVFRPANLIFTRLDETRSYGPILNETVRTGLPVSFLASGPRIPDDFEAATPSRIADLVVGSAAERPESNIGRGVGENTSQTGTSRATHRYAMTEPSPAEERERLILEHLPQVRLIARRIHERLPESVNFEDLISTGIIGLIAAIDRFDSGHNVKLKTYAEYKIRGAILDSLRGLDWAPRQQRKRTKQIEAAIAASRAAHASCPAKKRSPPS